VGLYVVPTWGWQWMFIIGAIPALVALPMRSILPESPRWLASRGRFAEADRNLKKLEDIAVREGKSLPPLPANLPPVVAVKTRFVDLFKGIYLKRTLVLWVVWICAYIITYGLTTWAPSLFRTVYKLPLQQSLSYGFILSGVALIGAIACVFLIDPMGRKRLFTLGLTVGSLPLLAFAFHGDRSAQEVLAMICLSYIFITPLALGLATYTAESYPNHLRALGGGVAGGWQRGASMLGPLLVGVLVPAGGPDLVFVVFGAFALVGAGVLFFFGHETGGKVLEEVSPATVAASPASAAGAASPLSN
jgi:putative MFS transporter